MSQLLSRGHSVSVITSSDNNQYKKDGDSMHIIRVPENLIGRIRSKISKKYISNPGLNESKFSRHKGSKLISNVVKGLYSFAIKKFQWPDFAWTWIFNARKAVFNYLEDNSEIDVVISVSHPFSSHLVGSIVKQKYPNIRWIMDIGDPFCFLIQSPPNNFLIYNRLNKFIERKYFSIADYISVTTSETKSEYLKLFPEIDRKIIVIPPILSNLASKILKTEKEKLKSNHQPLRLVYIGTLYSGIRHPKKILKILAEVRTLLNSDFEIHFYGPTNDIEISNLTNSYTFFHGAISHDAALRFMLDADILINIGNSTQFQLPSKLVEYICSGNPVLNIISSSSDSSKVFLTHCQMAKTIELSGEITKEIVNEVADYISFASTNILKVNNSDLSKFSVQNISKQYEVLFN